MRKHKKKAKRYFNNSTYRQSPNRRIIELKPEELAAYIRLAEKQVLPLIKEMGMDAGAAQFLLAQYTQTLVTNGAPFSVESAMTIANDVLTIWQAGYYTPSSEYPYSLEETLRELQEGPKARGDYSEWFQPFIPEKANLSCGLGEISAGIVKHPETHLWQIWTIIEGPCAYFGAYHDPITAQRGLEELLNLLRRGASPTECFALYHKLSSQGDEEPKQISYDMMIYLLENKEHYTICL